jgi:fatty-acyl-CoA synthase
MTSSQLTLTALADLNVARHPGQIAFIEDGRAITYADFDALSQKCAAWLAAQGIGPGDRVAVWLVNRIEWLALLFGLARLGATLVAVNTRYRASEFEYILDRSEARLLVLQPNFRKIDFASVLEGVNPAAIHALERVAIVDPDEHTPATLLGKPTVAFDAFSRSDPSSEDLSAPDLPLAVFTTSGTTRGPKLVLHTQRTVAYHIQKVASAFGFDEAGARLLGALPFCGVYGFDSALGAYAAGALTVLMDAFDAAAAVDLVRHHALTHLFGSDEMYQRMLELAPGDDPFPSVRMCGFAAFSPSAEAFAMAAWEKRIPMVGLYGSSEVQALFSYQPLSLPVEQRVEGGGLPVAGNEAQVRIRDVESRELLPAKRSGEIEIRAPGNFTGYLNNAEATAEAITADGFFRTGDIGYLREDGTFVYETRQGDAIRLGGFLVSPFDIEETLQRIPGVAAVQVVAVEIEGQLRAVAFVIAHAGQALRDTDIMAAAAKTMARFKVPARVWFVDEFPTTQSANGTKIQKAKLREMALARLAGTLSSSAKIRP